MTHERLGARHLSIVDAVAQSVGFVGPVFSAAFLIPLLVGVSAAAGRGAGAAAPLAVIIAAIGVLGLGWIVAQYARRIHAAGSLYEYVTDGLGDRIGTAAGWLYYTGIGALGAATLTLIGGYVHDTLQAEFGVAPVPAWCWSALAIAGVAGMLHIGVKVSTRAQLVLALVSMLAFLAFFISVIAQVGAHNSTKAFTPSAASSGWVGILFGVLYGVLLFTGFETAANLAEETAHPKRDIPRAVLCSVLIVAGFYIIAAYAQVAGFGFRPDAIGKAASGPVFALAAPHSAGGYGSVAVARILELVVLLDMLAVFIGVSVAASRGVFALARARRLPAVLARVSPVRATPSGAIAFLTAGYTTVLAATYTWPGLFAQPNTPHYAAMFSWLSAFGGIAIAAIYLLVSIGALRGLRDHPRRWAVVAAATVGIAVTAGALFGAVYKVPTPTVWAAYAALGWLTVGLLTTTVVKGGPAPATPDAAPTEAQPQVAFDAQTSAVTLD